MPTPLMKKQKNKFLFKHFYGKKMFKFCRLHLRKTYTNLFFTLTDLKNKVMCSLSLGKFSSSGNKRVKKSPVTIIKMITFIRKMLYKYKINKLEIIVRSKFTSELYTLGHELTTYGVKVVRIIDRKITAHNGVRGRRIRRK